MLVRQKGRYRAWDQSIIGHLVSIEKEVQLSLSDNRYCRPRTRVCMRDMRDWWRHKHEANGLGMRLINKKKAAYPYVRAY